MLRWIVCRRYSGLTYFRENTLLFDFYPITHKRQVLILSSQNVVSQDACMKKKQLFGDPILHVFIKNFN